MPRLIRGKVDYMLGNPQDPGPVTGREYFSVSVQANGLRTLRALCEMDEDGLTRDVTYTIGPDWKPREAYVRIALEDRVIGSGWFRFTESLAEGEGFTTAEGRFQQSFALNERVTAFGSHPICSDILRLAHIRTEGGDSPQRLTNCMNSSSLAHGDSGPILAWSKYTYLYKGKETLTVGAGSFDVHRIDWPVRSGKTLCMWTTGGDDYLPVRMTYPEGNKIYDLVELEIRP